MSGNLMFELSAGYASSQYAGTGYNGGFTSNYAGPNGVGAAAGTGAFVPGFAPFQPVPAFPNVFDYNSFYQGLQANFANSAATQAFATAGATAAASASLYGQYSQNPVYPHQGVQYQQPQQYQQMPQRSQAGSDYSYINNNNNNDHYANNGYNNYYNPHNMYQQQLAHQNALFNSIRQQQAAFAGAGAGAGAGYGAGVGAGGGSFGGAPGFAGSSASYGPGGFHQTAHIYPENPQAPNINTRFGGSSQPGGPGYVGVSSFSSSSNINGQSHREAATSVNDNGKVTSYHVRS
ncbi:fibroin heavy chain [Ochlerotatus camptorhynchus]|uniref:fibroin heavy chain n=1 Tax=Ochlerotatus camptorhynchus TaxID=644619 RepID=UPI0031DFCD97